MMMMMMMMMMLLLLLLMLRVVTHICPAGVSRQRQPG